MGFLTYDLKIFLTVNVTIDGTCTKKYFGQLRQHIF